MYVPLHPKFKILNNGTKNNDYRGSDFCPYYLRKRNRTR